MSSRPRPDLSLPSLKRRIHVPTELSTAMRSLTELCCDDPLLFTLVLDPPDDELAQLCAISVAGGSVAHEALVSALCQSEPLFQVLETAPTASSTVYRVSVYLYILY